MTKIQRVSRILQLVFIVCFIAFPLFETFYWLYYPINLATLSSSSTIPFNTRIGMWLVNLIPTIIHMFGFYYLVRLFKLYERQKIFTADNVRYIRNIGIVFIINELVNPLVQALTSLVLTSHNAPGKHLIAINITNYNIGNILIGIIILLVSWVMAEACKLQEEQSYTV